MPADLTGKRCIVTGGATGIGRATAIRIAELGAQVAIFDNNNEDGNDTAIQINDNGGNARFWSVDVRDEANVAGTVIAAKAWLEDIDVLLHFAGVLHRGIDTARPIRGEGLGIPSLTSTSAAPT